MKSPSSIVLLLSLLLPSACHAFVAPSSATTLSSRAPSSGRSAPSLPAKKKGGKKKRRRATPSSPGGGFGGTSPDPIESPPAAASAEFRAPLVPVDGRRPATNVPAPEPELELDPNLTPEERSQAILRSRFGLKSFEETQADLGDYRILLDAEKKKEKRGKLRNLDKLWPEGQDFVAVVPPAAIKGIDAFLKLGLGLCTTAFLVSGVFITIEAGAKATGSDLPDGLGSFVVDVIQPNFTPGLGVLLAFSVSLGVFSVALGGSASSAYREEP